MFSFIANKLKQAVNALSPSRKSEVKEFAKKFLDEIKDDIKDFEKKTSTKQKKDPDAPKRAKNPYIFFSTEKRPLIQEENPEMSPVEVTRKIAELWRELSDEDKDEYRKMSEDDKERYASELSDYKPENDENDKEKSGKKKKDPKAPKRARSAYIFFCTTKRQEIKSENEDLSSPDLMKKMGEIWSSMDEDEKKTYVSMAEKDKKRYQDEIEKYNDSNDSNDSNEDEEKSSKSKSKKDKDDEDEIDDDKKKKSKKNKDDDEENKSSKNKKSKKDEDDEDEKEDKKEKPKTKSAYVNFCSKNRTKVKEDFPDLTFGELSKKLGEMWRSMDEDEKAEYK